ncbi:MAG: integrase family protein [Gammaproteobacteria bacterium]|nr:integrase family protein [Gammaproteobacteria bacterium]
MKLNKTNVESLPTPVSGQSFYWDWDGLPKGFGVRVTASGARSYVIQKRIDGITKRITLGAHGSITCDQAKVRASEEVVLISKGSTSSDEKKRAKAVSVTLREVASAYIAERRTSKGGPLAERTKQDILKHVDKAFHDWADKPIRLITRDMCSKRFTGLSAKGPTQANASFRYLRALINYAKEAYRPGDVPIILENPVSVLSGKRMWNPNNAKNGRIPMEKIGDVWNLLHEKRVSDAVQTIGKTGADIILFLLMTGARWSEAAELKWENVDIEVAAWHIPDPKNHNPVFFPISKQLRSILAERKKQSESPYVFPSRGKAGFIADARFSLGEVSEAAGAHITAHDLRRTFISIGVSLKIEMWKLKLLTNHISKGDVTIDHYTETSDLRYLSHEIQQISTWLGKQGAIAAAGNVVQLRKRNTAA